MKQKYKQFLNEMLVYIKAGSPLSEPSKRIAKEFKIGHDLIFYAHAAGYLTRIAIGKYKSNVRIFTNKHTEHILLLRKNVIKNSHIPKKKKKGKSKIIIRKRVGEADLTINSSYFHPRLGIVKLVEIISQSKVGVEFIPKKEKEKRILTSIHSRLLKSYTESIPKSHIESVSLKRVSKFTERNNKIMELVRSGTKIDEIASLYNLGKSAISIIAKSNGIKVGQHRKTKRDTKRKETSIRKKEILNDIKLGLSFNEIKCKYTLNENESKRFERKTNIAKRNKKIAEYYKDGYTSRQLSDLFSLSHATIAPIIRKLNAYKYPELSITVGEKSNKIKELVSIINTLKSQGLNVSEIVDELNENGYKNLRGGEFSKASIFNLMPEDIIVKPIVRKSEPIEKTYLDLYMKRKKKI